MLGQVISAVVGLLVSLAAGRLGVPRVLKAVKIETIDPSWPNSERLRAATHFEGRSGVALLGVLERMFFYAAFLMGNNAGIAIAGWLAFKVATKWAAWQHVVGMPSIPVLDDHLQALHYRNAFGTWMVSRTLLGTLYNILCGLVGMIAAKILIIYLR